MTDEELDALLTNIANGTFLDATLDLGMSEEGGDEQSIYHRLNDNHLLRLVTALRNNQNIKSIDFSYNNITDIGGIALSEIDTLDELNFQGTMIGIQGALTIVERMSLKKLVLRFVPFEFELNEELKVNLMKAFVKNESIIELDLSCCSLSPKIIAQIIEKNTKIKILFLNFSGHVADEALEFIGNNSTLEVLNISNSISDVGIGYIMSNSSLKSFNMTETCVTDIGAQRLSTHPSLKSIHIMDSHITKAGALFFLENSNLDDFSIETNRNQSILSHKSCAEVTNKFRESRGLEVFPFYDDPWAYQATELDYTDYDYHVNISGDNFSYQDT